MWHNVWCAQFSLNPNQICHRGVCDQSLARNKNVHMAIIGQSDICLSYSLSRHAIRLPSIFNWKIDVSTLITLFYNSTWSILQNKRIMIMYDTFLYNTIWQLWWIAPMISMNYQYTWNVKEEYFEFLHLFR